MRYGGQGWRPNNRRNRRRGGGTKRSTERGANRAFVVFLVLFVLAALGLVFFMGLLST